MVLQVNTNPSTYYTRYLPFITPNPPRNPIQRSRAPHRLTLHQVNPPIKNESVLPGDPIPPCLSGIKMDIKLSECSDRLTQSWRGSHWLQSSWTKGSDPPAHTQDSTHSSAAQISYWFSMSFIKKASGWLAPWLGIDGLCCGPRKCQVDWGRTGGYAKACTRGLHSYNTPIENKARPYSPSQPSQGLLEKY